MDLEKAAKPLEFALTHLSVRRVGRILIQNEPVDAQQQEKQVSAALGYTYDRPKHRITEPT